MDLLVQNDLKFLEKECVNLSTLKRKDRENLLLWYNNNKLDFPWRVFWKELGNPFHIWVSEVMLQQTLIKVVVPIYIRFIKKFPDVLAFAKASEEEIRPYVKGLGYYRRFALLHKGAKEITSTGEVVWPNSYASWLNVSGVGVYTASAISSIVLNEKQGVLDGNVERVFSRIFNIYLPMDEKGLKAKYQDLANKYLITKNPGDYNQALMELGQRVCTKNDPECGVCMLQSSCLSYKYKTQAIIPIPKKRKKIQEVLINLNILRFGSEFLLIQRSKKAKFLKEKLGFYSPEIEKEACLKLSKQQEKTYLGSFTHNITHHKIKAKVFLFDLKKKVLASNIKYVKQKNLAQIIISNLDQKTLDLL